MGRPKLFSEAWNQTDEEAKLYFVGLLFVIVGGAALGAVVWERFVRKVGLISDEALRRM